MSGDNTSLLEELKRKKARLEEDIRVLAEADELEEKAREMNRRAREVRERLMGEIPIGRKTDFGENSKDSQGFSLPEIDTAVATQKEVLRAFFLANRGKRFDVKTATGVVRTVGKEFTSADPVDSIRGTLNRMVEEDTAEKVQDGTNVFYGVGISKPANETHWVPKLGGKKNPMDLRARRLQTLIEREPDVVWTSERASEAWLRADLEDEYNLRKKLAIALQRLSKQGFLDEVTPEGARVLRFKMRQVESRDERN